MYRGIRWLWWIDGNGGNDLDRRREHGHESNDRSGFDHCGVNWHGNVDSGCSNHNPISFDLGCYDIVNDRGDDTLDDRDPNYNCDCDRDSAQHF